MTPINLSWLRTRRKLKLIRRRVLTSTKAENQKGVIKKKIAGEL